MGRGGISAETVLTQSMGIRGHQALGGKGEVEAGGTGAEAGQGVGTRGEGTGIRRRIVEGRRGGHEYWIRTLAFCEWIVVNVNKWK